jgi:PAS domain S-box-containing protein
VRDIDRTAAPITVLLVDDDRQWARLVAEDIEAEADAISVTVAGSATECLEVFRNRDDIDCILADYQMPGTDGLQLLEQIRDEHPQLPFLLVTSQGSELVAARATDAGVTDYLIKDVGGEQVPHFVTKIERAVTHYRLQRAIEESEQRYRTVTEQSRDGIALVQNGQLAFCNERLTELTGRTRATLQDTDIVAEIVHPDDRDWVRSVVESWLEDEEQSRLQEARIVQPDGTVKSCEYTGGRIDYGGEAAVLLSIRDVTERNRRERELQWERELNRTIQEGLVESRTRDSLERTVIDQLQRHGYALAWIGEQVGDEVVPRRVGGDSQYVDALDRSLDGDTVDGEPAVRAAHTGQAQFCEHVRSRSPAAWTATAAKHGYRSCAAVLLVHNDISYGVLAVYHEQPDRFDETEQRLLGELADTVAFAIHSLETRDALAADQPVEMTVELSNGHYLLDLARQDAFGDCATVHVVGTVPVDDETALQYLEVSSGSAAAVREAVEDSPAVREAAVVTEDDPTRVQVTVTEPVPESHLASRGVVVDSTTVGAEAVTLSFELETRADLRPTAESLSDQFGPVSVRAIAKGTPGSDTDGDSPGTAADLTEKQHRALKAAYYKGYFEQPRESSATEVAEALGVSHPTFLHHLRAAQRKQFGLQFE